MCSGSGLEYISGWSHSGTTTWSRVGAEKLSQVLPTKPNGSIPVKTVNIGPRRVPGALNIFNCQIKESTHSPTLPSTLSSKNFKMQLSRYIKNIYFYTTFHLLK